MSATQIAALAVMAAFFTAYFSKNDPATLPRREKRPDRQGQQTEMPIVEEWMKIATHTIVAAEVVRVVFDFCLFRRAIHGA